MGTRSRPLHDGREPERILAGVFVVALVPIVIGILVGWGGFLASRDKLSRDRGAGVRTRASLRSAEAFRMANQIAAVPTLTAGIVGVLTGVAALLMPTTVTMLTAIGIGLISMFVLVAGGGILGHRAAEAVPAPSVQTTPSCGGCLCGGGGCTAGTGDA